MKDIVIVEGVRTPFSPFGGPLRDVPSIELGACVMKEIVKRSGLKGNQIDEIFYGSDPEDVLKKVAKEKFF